MKKSNVDKSHDSGVYRRCTAPCVVGSAVVISAPSCRVESHARFIRVKDGMAKPFLLYSTETNSGLWSSTQHPISQTVSGLGKHIPSGFVLYISVQDWKMLLHRSL